MLRLSMLFDFQAIIVSVIQLIALILLLIGVYPIRIRTKNRNLIMHGFLTILALALNLTTVIVVMIPAFSVSINLLGGLSILQATIVYLHVALGAAALTLGFVIIASWIIHPLGELGCSKVWRLMLPTFLIWTVSLILGLVIHFFEII
jgi:hypothetical protein